MITKGVVDSALIDPLTGLPIVGVPSTESGDVLIWTNADPDSDFLVFNTGHQIRYTNPYDPFAFQRNDSYTVLTNDGELAFDTQGNPGYGSGSRWGMGANDLRALGSKIYLEFYFSNYAGSTTTTMKSNNGSGVGIVANPLDKYSTYDDANDLETLWPASNTVDTQGAASIGVSWYASFTASYYVNNPGVDSTLSDIDVTQDSNDLTDIIMLAVDLTNELVWVGINGTWLHSGDPGAGTNPLFAADGSGFDPTSFTSPLGWANMEWYPYSSVRGSIGANEQFLVGLNGRTGHPYAYTVPTGFNTEL